MNGPLPAPALAEAALRGGDAPLDALAKAWLPHVYAWCHRLGGPRIDAEDAAHETLIVMCRGLQRVHAPGAFPSWLFGICRKVVANHRRRAWFRRWLPGPLVERVATTWGPDRALEARQAAALVWGALDALRAEQREVLVLCELEERSAAEVAVLLEIPIGTVKSRLRLARAAFRRVLEPQHIDSGEPVSVEVG